MVVTADATVKGAKLAAVKAMVAELGDAARLEIEAGTLSTFISGGDAIYTGGGRCSLGFNVRNSAGTQLLPDRRPLHQHRLDLDQRLAARWAPGPAPASRATTTASCATPTRRISKPGAVGSPGHHLAPAPRPSAPTVTRRGSTTGTRCGTGHRAERHGQLRRRAGQRPDPHHRLRPARRQRRLALLRHRGLRPDLRRQRQLHHRRHHVLPAGHRGARRLRRVGLLIHHRTGPAAMAGPVSAWVVHFSDIAPDKDEN